MNIYDYGQWYRVTYYYMAHNKCIKECVYTQDETICIDEKIKNQMKAKGYKYYYCDPRVDGEWDGHDEEGLAEHL